MQIETKYMQRCLDLAQKGFKSVAPNPMVGCVIVSNGKIIGEGFHIKYGEAHAEVNAINNVKDKALLKNATLYVSLEPCAHFGKTPPCSDLIIKHQIPNVVIACVDPYAEVAGKGIEKLRSKGISVEVGCLEKEALELNKRFFTFHDKMRPYIVLKWAETQDGFIDLIRTSNKTQVNWITQAQTKQLTDTWRTEEAAILVGKNTVLKDNPRLTVRTILGRNPIRLVIDKNNELNQSFSIFDNSVKTIVFNEKVNSHNEQTFQVKIPFKNTLNELLDWLFQNNIQSVIVEGGAFTLQQFIDQNLWDEARVYRGISFFNQGVLAPTIQVTHSENTSFGLDQLTVQKNNYD